MLFIDGGKVRATLTYDLCIPVVRDAMVAFSSGETRQLLRSVIPLAHGKLFGIMPGALRTGSVFGAKLVSVFHHGSLSGGPSHQGIVVLFDGTTGAPVCIVDGGEITAIRTAAASAVATDVLARPEAARLAILGCGVQAWAHARAISKVRELSAITIWARSPDKAADFAAAISAELGVEAVACNMVDAAVASADMICTLTGAAEPILSSRWVRPGTHINLVGSSDARAAEIDNDLVARSRYIADSREGVRSQGGEFVRARHAGLITDQHIEGEIGEVLAGTVKGRQTTDQVTIYKSLGHVVQDLATANALYEMLVSSH